MTDPRQGPPSPVDPLSPLVPATPARLLVLLGILAACRLVLGTTFDLMPQEAYYWFYSLHPALSYFDHPPAVAVVLWVARAVLGTSELTLRMAALVVTSATLLATWRLGVRLLGPRPAATALVLLGTTGAVTMLSLVTTPDVPLLLAWSLSLLLLERAVFAGSRLAWLGAGLCMGLAFDAKYTAVFLQGGLLLFLGVSSPHRRLLLTPWPWLALVTAQVAAAPVWVWNARNGWASFLFQTGERAAGAGGPTLRYLLELVGSQSLLLAPPLLGAALLGTWGPVRDALCCGRTDPRLASPRLFLACFTAPLLAAFGLVSLFTRVKANWLLPAWLGGALLAAAWGARRTVSWNLGFSAVFHAVLVTWILVYPVPLRTDDTWFGWSTLAARVQSVRAGYPGAFVFADDEYKTTAELGFYGVEDVFAGNVVGRRALQYDHVGTDLGALAGRDALFLDSAPHDATPDRSGRVPPKLEPWFASVEELDPIVLEHRGFVARKFHVYLCRGYRPAGEDGP